MTYGGKGVWQEAAGGQQVIEADIIISGVPLSEAQSMTVRVAVECLRRSMDETDAIIGAIGSDEVGVSVAKLYRDRCSEVAALIMRTAR